MEMRSFKTPISITSLNNYENGKNESLVSNSLTYYYPQLLAKISDKNCDEFGFNLPYPNLSLNEIEEFNIKYNKIINNRVNRWNDCIDLNEPVIIKGKMKRFIRKGIPHNLRAKLWSLYSGADKSRDINNNLYFDIIKGMKLIKTDNQFTQQLENDINRTLTNNVHFQGNDSIIKYATRRVLIVYNVFKPEVRYHQAFTYIVSFLLLILNEETTFHIFLNLLDKIMPNGMYRLGSCESIVEIETVLTILRYKLPRLYKHIKASESQGMPPITMAMLHWFLVIFIDLLPPMSVVRVFDSLLYEGKKVLFRVSIALFKLNESYLLTINDPCVLFNEIQNLPKRALDCHLLMRTAFSRFCSVSTKELNDFRAYQMELLE